MFATDLNTSREANIWNAVGLLGQGAGAVADVRRPVRRPVRVVCILNGDLHGIIHFDTCAIDGMVTLCSVWAVSVEQTWSCARSLRFLLPVSDVRTRRILRQCKAIVLPTIA